MKNVHRYCHKAVHSSRVNVTEHHLLLRHCTLQRVAGVRLKISQTCADTLSKCVSQCFHHVGELTVHYFILWRKKCVKTHRAWQWHHKGHRWILSSYWQTSSTRSYFNVYVVDTTPPWFRQEAKSRRCKLMANCAIYLDIVECFCMKRGEDRLGRNLLHNKDRCSTLQKHCLLLKENTANMF